MSIIQRFANSWRGGKLDPRPWPGWARAEAQAINWGEFDKGKIDYSQAAKHYTDHDLVYMCAKKLGDLAADGRLLLFPKGVDKDPQTGLPKLEDALNANQHGFYEVWDNPNPYDSRAELLEAIAITVQISPNGCYLHLDDGNRPIEQGREQRIELTGEPVALWWLTPEAMTVKSEKDRLISAFIHEMAGQKTTFTPEAIIRIIEFNPNNRLDSLSHLQPAQLASLTDQMAQRGEYALFKNGLRFDGVITSEKDFVDPGDLKIMEKLWKERHAGPEKWGGFFPLWAGFKYDQMSITPADAQSDETAQRNRSRIFGVFGVHPGVILSEDVNLANAKVAEHVTRAFTLRPLLRRIADEITPRLEFFPGPPAEAHFVNVVPQDSEAEAAVDKMKAESANTKAQAVASLVDTFGPITGVTIAKEWQIIPPSISADEILQRETEKLVQEQQRQQANLERIQAMQQGQQQQPGQPGQQPPAAEQARKLYAKTWQTKNGTIVPVMPAIPEIDAMDDEPGEDELNRMLRKFYEQFPDLTGILETGNGNGNG